MDEDKNSQVVVETQEMQATEEGLSRRGFLGVGGATVGATLAGGLGGIAMTLEPSLTGDAAEAAFIGPTSLGHRRNEAFKIRHDAAKAEKQLGTFSHPCNGDEEAYTSRIGNFHKTLPHLANGEVDPAAYDALLTAVESGDFADWEAVPQGNGAATQRLLNPLGGLAFNMEGPDAAAITVNPPPSVDSPELAAMAAEVYWMSLLRDIPFANWNTDANVLAACASLNTYSAYNGPRDPVSGLVTPQVLFRSKYPGAFDGPMVSQFLLRNFFYDGIAVTPRITTAQPNTDFMTEWNEWLRVQNGGPNGGVFGALDPVTRFPRNPRDLGMVAGLDRVYSVYFRAFLILQALFPFSTSAGLDANHPYQPSIRQAGFSTFGQPHLTEMIGSSAKRENHGWFQKWQVHRFLRPEAYGGLVHRVVAEGASYPIHSDLLNDTALMTRVFNANQARNITQGLSTTGTYLLSQLFRNGSPTHPSFPSGHAVSAGAGVTILKAFYNEAQPFPAPVKISADGLTTAPYVAGVDGPALTLGSELNKLAHNLTHGRDMSGVHWRVDGEEGNRQGEELAIRWLREQAATHPEPFAGFNLTKFDGTTIVV